MKIAFVCAHCGGSNVQRDAWAVWSPENQQWELGAVFDDAHCDDCDGATSLEQTLI